MSAPPSFPTVEFRVLEGLLYRMIESQEVVATRSIVSNLAKQELLESMLDTYSKPSPSSYPAHRHYLLSTPFRYPPLKYGSRFGTRMFPSLFYGSLGRAALLAECAYYRFVLWQDMVRAPPKAIEAEHTMFSAAYLGERGVDLSQGAFKAHRAQIRHPSDYTYTQRLGAHLRKKGASCFFYPSARDPEAGINIGIFEPEVLVDNAPRSTSTWSSRTDAKSVEFYSIRARLRERFEIGVFCDQDGDLPRPA